MQIADLKGKNLRSKFCDLSKKKLAVIIAAGAFGAAAPLTGTTYNCWVVRLGPHKLVEVSLFLKPLIKLKLAHLIAATSNFKPQNVIASTWTGTTYKAMLLDGSMLATKRLSACKPGEKQFQMETKQPGLLKHPNLVPFLGFCVLAEEKLLVYKYMSNGNLYSL